MNLPSSNAPTEQLSVRLKDLDAQLRLVAADCSRLRRAVKKALADIAKEPWPIRGLESLLTALKKPAQAPIQPQLLELTRAVEHTLGSLTQGFEHSFRGQLRDAAEQQGVAYVARGDQLALGPFELVVNRKKNSAELVYAKAPFTTGLPLDPSKIVETAKSSSIALLERRDKLETLVAELDEAVMVTLAREKRSTRLPELRAELPEVYREMGFIRQTGKKPLTKQTVEEYPLARFVVEVATVIRSDENLAADRSFRLETAVIENTRNRRKSVFIPKDLRKGYGEGMYYQALILQQAL